MQIQHDVQREIERALAVVQDHLEHDYAPKQRRQLFMLFKSDPFRLRVWRWLAVITALRVQPLYDAYLRESKRGFLYYDIKRPQKSLKMAEGVLLGRVAAELGYGKANGAYDQDDFDYVEWRTMNPVPFKFYMASWSASIALLEASKDDLDPFLRLSDLGYAKGGFSMGKDIGHTVEQEDPDGISGENMSNSIWAESGHSDTAAVASTAWACEEDSKDMDAMKLHEFWEWWLTDAIQQAWQRAIG